MASRASRYVSVGPASLERRGSIRMPVHIEDASIRHHGEEPQGATLTDVSAFGCRLLSDGEHEAGKRVWLRFAGRLPIAATVVWAREGQVGCRFDTDLPREIVRLVTVGPDAR